MSTAISPQQVGHVASLASIPVTADEEKSMAKAFAETLDVIAQLQQLDVSKTQPTHQVTGLENVWREDVVITENMFTQSEALANAAQTYQGYIVVPQIINQQD